MHYNQNNFFWVVRDMSVNQYYAQHLFDSPITNAAITAAGTPPVPEANVDIVHMTNVVP